MKNISEVIPEVLNALVERRVWQGNTPDDLPRGQDGALLPFVIWHVGGGIESEYVDQTAAQMQNYRVHIRAVHTNQVACDQLIVAVRNALLASGYTVGVYGSPAGDYDKARKLYERYQQFSIWV